MSETNKNAGGALQPAPTRPAEHDGLAPGNDEGRPAQGVIEILARAIAQRALEYAYGANIPRPNIEVENHFLRSRELWIAEAEAAVGAIRFARGEHLACRPTEYVVTTRVR